MIPDFDFVSIADLIDLRELVTYTFTISDYEDLLI